MKSFDEVVYCKTQEEWDAVIDWVEYYDAKAFKSHFTKLDDICMKFYSPDDMKYADKEFYGSRPYRGKVITFQEFKDKYMSASDVISQSPSEPQKFKSDGGSSDYYKITLTNKDGESIKVEMD